MIQSPNVHWPFEDTENAESESNGSDISDSAWDPALLMQDSLDMAQISESTTEL